MQDQRTIRFCGWVGISGASLLLASDWLMLESSTSARDLAEGWLTFLAEMPR